MGRRNPDRCGSAVHVEGQDGSGEGEVCLLWVEGKDRGVARGVVPGSRGGGRAQAGRIPTRRARTAERQRRVAAPRARETEPPQRDGSRTHAVPGPSIPTTTGGRAGGSLRGTGADGETAPGSRSPSGRRPVGLSPRVRADGAAPRPRMLDRDLQRLSRATQRFPGYGDPRNLQPSRRTAGSVHACAHPVGRWCGTGTGWRCSARRSGSSVPMHMSYRSTGIDRDRCAAVGLAHHGIPERGAVHAGRWCECQRHTGHRGVTRRRFAARASGVRTGAATHRHPRQGRRTTSLARATPTP